MAIADHRRLLVRVTEARHIRRGGDFVLLAGPFRGGCFQIFEAQHWTFLDFLDGRLVRLDIWLKIINRLFDRRSHHLLLFKRVARDECKISNSGLSIFWRDQIHSDLILGPDGGLEFKSSDLMNLRSIIYYR